MYYNWALQAPYPGVHDLIACDTIEQTSGWAIHILYTFLQSPNFIPTCTLSVQFPPGRRDIEIRWSLLLGCPAQVSQCSPLALFSQCRPPWPLAWCRWLHFLAHTQARPDPPWNPRLELPWGNYAPCSYPQRPGPPPALLSPWLHLQEKRWLITIILITFSAQWKFWIVCTNSSMFCLTW